MSILDKHLLLGEIEEQISNNLPKNQATSLLNQISNCFENYDISHIESTNEDQDSQELIKLFLNTKKLEGRSEQTIEHYQYVLNRLLQSVNVPLNKITIFHLRNYLSSEQERGISLKTLEGNRSIYSSCFGWLNREGLIDTNPCNNLAPIKQQKIIRKPFSPIEIQRIKEACVTSRDKALVYFFLSTGCRVGEVCALNKDQINFQEKEIVVFGKGSKQRTVYIDDVTAMMLKRYFIERKDKSEALFAGKGTDRLTPSGIRSILNKIGHRANVENVHPHRFRRTLATTLINHGMSIQEVATILGHDKLDTTMKYVYIDKTSIKNAYAKYS